MSHTLDHHPLAEKPEDISQSADAACFIQAGEAAVAPLSDELVIPSSSHLQRCTFPRFGHCALLCYCPEALVIQKGG